MSPKKESRVRINEDIMDGITRNKGSLKTKQFIESILEEGIKKMELERNMQEASKIVNYYKEVEPIERIIENENKIINLEKQAKKLQKYLDDICKITGIQVND